MELASIRAEVKQWLRRGLDIVLPLWQLQARNFEARRLAAVKVNTCETSQLGGLPFPGLDAVTSALPSPDVVRPRLVVMERFMRAVPFWQPLREKEILPTAESDLEDEMMGKRWRDAVVGALLLIGVAVAMAQFFAAVGNCVAERTHDLRSAEFQGSDSFGLRSWALRVGDFSYRI